MGTLEWLAAGAITIWAGLWLLAIAIESWRPR
jgi:hypothetical protein